MQSLYDAMPKLRAELGLAGQWCRCT